MYMYINSKSTFQSSLLPEASGYWEKALRVRMTEGPIRLRRKCLTSYYFYRPEKNTVACDKGCKVITTCGEATIPNEHLLVSTHSNNKHNLKLP